MCEKRCGLDALATLFLHVNGDCVSEKKIVDEKYKYWSFPLNDELHDRNGESAWLSWFWAISFI